MAVTGRHRRERHDGPDWAFIRCLTVSPDGRLLVGGFHDGTVRLWPLWSSLLHKPIGLITPADRALLQSLTELPAPERAWVELISALVGYRHRHDVEVADAPSPVAVGEWDIELNG